MNSLKPENVVFVPKSKGTSCFLSCFTSLVVFLVGFLVFSWIYSVINY